MIGRTLAHYRITAAIGAGGMGEVYRATDTRLGRDVALKVLPAEVTADADRIERFQREARALAALDHPGIVTVYSVEEGEGVHFLTMQLVEGQSLDRIIPADGLPVERIVGIATALAEALTAAHERGIVHRDLKPANVMVAADWRVKVLDFGLAKVTEAGAEPEATVSHALTQAGAVMGTMPYMSPEQVSGRPVDHRTDIFALGVILYEMATGRRPFQGASSAELVSAIMRDTPVGVAGLRADVPAALARLVGRCLEKDARKRIQTARDVANELADLAPAAAPPRSAAPDSGAARLEEGFWIAVLPFASRGADPELAAFADGLGEDITTGLSRFPHLFVISRSSAMQNAGRSLDVRTLGRELGARYALEGAIRKAGTTIRVSAQLLDTSTGAHLWAETYDRDLAGTGIFKVQDEITDRVVATVADPFGVLVRSMAAAVRGRPLEELTATELVLRFFAYWHQIRPDEHARLRTALEQKLEREPAHPDAWAYLSRLYSHEHQHRLNLLPDSVERARTAARRAVEIDPTCQAGWEALAEASYFARDLGTFRNAAERAMSLNPRNTSTVALMGVLISYSGEWDRGTDIMRRSMELNPHHAGWYHFPLFFDHYRRREFDEALDTTKRINMPEFFWTHAAAAAASGRLGRKEEARAALGTLRSLLPGYRQELGPTLGLWIVDGTVVEQVMEGLAEAEALVDARPQEAPASAPPELPVPDLPSRSPSRAGSRFGGHTVGRQSESDGLRAALEAARAGRGSLVCVAGEPGIGKTTLVEGFLGSAVADGGCTVAHGRCSERLAGSEAYLPVLEALDSLLKGSQGSTVTGIMKRVAPVWYSQLAPLSGHSDESARQLEEIRDATQERLKREFVACVQEISQPRPLVLFLDDLHWADVSTIDLLSFLAGTLGGSSVLVVVTYRPSDMLLSKHPFLQIKPDLQGRGLCREMALGFLGESEIAEYLALEFPGHGFPPELPALIHAKTEGSPLFMADLVRYLRDHGAIGETEGRWTLERGLAEMQRELPESVRGMIERKIGQLDEGERTLLTAASVQGHLFDSAIAAQVLGLPADHVEERLEKLERVHALVSLTGESELPDRTLNLRYRFVHALYQNALYASLPATRRARLSRQVAQAIERAHGGNSPGVAHELAALYEAGRDFARAADYYLAATRQASRVSAHTEASTLAVQGLAMVAMLDPTAERNRRELELQLALGLALRWVRGFGHADTGKAYARARELCHDIGEAPQLFAVLFGLWEFYQNQGDLEAAVEVGTEMIALAEGSGEPGQLVAAHGAMADNLLCVGDPVTASGHAAQAAAHYVPEEHRSLTEHLGYDPAVSARSMGALALWQAGYPDQAVQGVDAAADLASTFSHPASQALGAVFASWIHRLTGSLEAAGQAAERGVGIATEFNLPAFRDFCRVCEGWVLIARGRALEGTALALRAVEGLQAIEFSWARSFTLGVVAEGRAATGMIAEALALVGEALDHADRTGERFQEAELYRLKGELLLRSDPRPGLLEVERCFLKGIEIAQRQQARSWELRATISLARFWKEQGRLADARARLERVRSWFTEGFRTEDLVAADALLVELEA